MVLMRHWRMMAAFMLTGLLCSLPLAAQQRGRYGNDLDSTVERIRKETGGRVLHAETRDNQGNREHRVRIITDQGTVKRYRFDAGSGEEMPPGKRRR